MAEQYPSAISDKLQIPSFGYEIDKNFIESDMEIGPPKVRRRNTKRNDKFTGNIFFTKTELDIFFQFYNTTLQDGSLTFLFNDPLNTGTDIEVRFIEAPTFNLVGFENFSIAFSLEKM